jgi:hypothetical protein
MDHQDRNATGLPGDAERDSAAGYGDKAIVRERIGVRTASEAEQHDRRP